MARSLEDIFGKKSEPVVLTRQQQDAAIADIFQPVQQQRRPLSEIFASNKKQKSFDIKPDTGLARTALEQSMQGATFAMSDEAMDVIGSVIASAYTGEPFSKMYKEAREASQKRLEAQMEENPITSVVSNLGGALLTGGASATTKAGAKATNFLRSGNLATRMAKGFAAGGATAAAYGAGAEDDNRIEGALRGAIYGAPLGGAAPAVGAGVSKVIDKYAKKAAIESGEIVAPKAEKEFEKIYKKLKKDFPDEQSFRQALNSYLSSQNKSLLEAGGRYTAGLAEGASAYPATSAKAAQFFEESSAGKVARLKKTLEKTISPKINYYDTLDDVVEVGRAQASPLYKEAFKKNQSVQSPVIDKILSTPEGKSALADAVKNLQNEMTLVAKPDKELTQLVKELSDIGLMEKTGSGVAKGLKLRALDEVKKSMDYSIRKAIRAGDDAEVKRISNLKNALVREIDSNDKSGLYARARSVAGDYLSTKEAMDTGLNFLTSDSQLVQKIYKDFNPAQKRAYKVGVLKTIRDDIDSKIDGRNVTTLFQKPENRQKLQTILNKQEYSKLMADAKAADNIFKLKNQITGNSRTVFRQIAAQEFDNEAQQILQDVASKGVIGTARENALNYVIQKIPGMEKQAEAVAEILYETDPKKKFKIVKELVNIANAETDSVRKTQAAQKLAAYYKVSDAISNLRKLSSPAAEMATRPERQALEVTITPRGPNLPTTNQ